MEHATRQDFVYGAVRQWQSPGVCDYAGDAGSGSRAGGIFVKVDADAGVAGWLWPAAEF
jgi:hypothetical protein